MAATAGTPSDRRRTLLLLTIGLTAGFFSGLFGIGGGLIVVPGLVLVLRLDQRRAVGTSLLAIVPAVVVGAVSYAYGGGVVPVAAALLAVGAVVGAQVGTRLLMVLSRRVAQWIFIVFVAVSVVQLLLVVPDRGQDFPVDPWRGVWLVVLGLVAGALSAILGVGGGGIVVPVLMLAFGASDLVAKGSSLVMMLPGVLSGLVANLRRHNVDVRAGLVVGAASVITSPLGAWLAHAVPPRAGAVLFAGFLVFVLVSMVRQALRPDPPQVHDEAPAPAVPPPD